MLKRETASFLKPGRFLLHNMVSQLRRFYTTTVRNVSFYNMCCDSKKYDVRN
jgi:hypothetical protein